MDLMPKKRRCRSLAESVRLDKTEIKRLKYKSALVHYSYCSMRVFTTNDVSSPNCAHNLLTSCMVNNLLFTRHTIY